MHYKMSYSVLNNNAMLVAGLNARTRSAHPTKMLEDPIM